MILGVPDLAPLVQSTDQDPDPSTSSKNSKKILDSYFFVTFYDFLSLKMHVASKIKKQKNFFLN
jgi:hypothetical protein